MVLGSKVIFQPLGAEPDRSILSAGAVPSLATMIGTVVCSPATARALTRPSRPAMESRGCPAISMVSSVLAEASAADAVTSIGKVPASTEDGGRTLSLTSLEAPASIGTEDSSWVP